MRFNCCFCKLNVSDRTKPICSDHCNDGFISTVISQMILTMKILQQVMIYGIVNYVLKKFYLFVLNKLILMKITQVILILTLIF